MLDLVGNPEDQLSCVVAHVSCSRASVILGFKHPNSRSSDTLHYYVTPVTVWNPSKSSLIKSKI